MCLLVVLGGMGFALSLMLLGFYSTGTERKAWCRAS